MLHSYPVINCSKPTNCPLVTVAKISDHVNDRID
uniref:Uncharacterized protein n=1 Tax=Anguilla anguilla TaxID=7936 RepID=A0A0E9WF66_ANGAN